LPPLLVAPFNRPWSVTRPLTPPPAQPPLVHEGTAPFSKLRGACARHRVRNPTRSRAARVGCEAGEGEGLRVPPPPIRLAESESGGGPISPVVSCSSQSLRLQRSVTSVTPHRGSGQRPVGSYLGSYVGFTWHQVGGIRWAMPSTGSSKRAYAGRAKEACNGALTAGGGWGVCVRQVVSAVALQLTRVRSPAPAAHTARRAPKVAHSHH
jgi:hypothetical protein